MKIKQVLMELGLNDSEADIYMQLIKTSGAHPASTIAQRLDLNRTTVYKSLLKLTKMGLAAKSMKHGVLCFFAEEPDKNIDKLLIKRKSKLDFISELFLESIPEIQHLQKEDLYTPKVRYYEGFEGVKRVYEDTLIQSDTIYAFENVDEMEPKIQDFIMNDYVPRRVKKGIFAYVITPKTGMNEDFRENDKRSKRETKFIGTDAFFPIEIELNIYGKKTAFFSYRADEMFAVIIESSSIANSMRGIFNVCWKLAN